MPRDNDLLRRILLEASEEEDGQILAGTSMGMSDSEAKEYHHIQLLVDSGLMTTAGQHSFRITSDGYDFIEAVQDDTIWTKTKKVATDAGGVTITMLAKIAKDMLKTKIEAVINGQS